ncbi:MAG: tetratricopeptide repeat protein [Pyrinomonadaceae bacterium]
MKYLAVNRIAVLIVCAALSAAVTLGQDLGSANKLFGKGKKAASSKKTTKKAPPKTSSKKASSKKVRSAAKKKTTPAKSSNSTQAKSGAGVPIRKFEAFASRSKPAAKVSPADERRFEELIDSGNAARDNRNYPAAESAYKQASVIKPYDWRAIYGLGNLFSDQQRWEDAETAYRSALKIDQTNAITHIALSYVLTQPLLVSNLSDRYSEAEAIARRATQLAPANALAYDQLGVAREQLGLIGDETEKAYRKAISLDRTFAPAHAHLGRFLRRRGMMSESAAAYKEAISRANDVGTLVLVAEVMQSEQRYADSESLLRRALTNDPQNAAGLLLLGRALTTQAKYVDAEQALRKSVTVSPNAYMPNNLLGSLFLRQAKFDMAENALLQALRFVTPLEKRGLSQQFERLGDAFSKAGNLVKAERSYRQAFALDGDNKSIADKLPDRRAG